jgi:hypothetical protein
MTKPLILLDFDGVLFNSAYEAYQVCERMVGDSQLYRKGVSFDEFMTFRAQVTDAWQFSRLYNKSRALDDITKLSTQSPDEIDWTFTQSFFGNREKMMEDPDWAKVMSPYPFFYQIRPFLREFPEVFKILSTRNKTSIARTLEFFGANSIAIYGQEDIRKYDSKLGVAKSNRWLNNSAYVVYIDDMNSHLEPFENEVDLCIHAGWGYDVSQVDSYTQSQAYQIIKGFLKLSCV